MNILVVGSGGREHALVWKIRQSRKVATVYCAPGNAGIAEIAECVDIAPTDIDALCRFAQQHDIALTVVGPEAALVAGIVDRFEENNLRIFGPRQNAAILEGSKVFTKEFLQKYNIPTADFRVFTDRDEAYRYVAEQGAPIVIKADGLAAGKGVVVAQTVAEAQSAIDRILSGSLGAATGGKIVIEACLKGEEASFIAFTDGITVLPLPTSQDHKAAFDGDRGPNTGGMGAYSPAPVVTPEIATFVMEKVMLPTIRGMAQEGRPYRGMLYAGLMIDGGEVNVLEFNCRFGDPEAQPLLMRVESDIIDIFDACLDETLSEQALQISPGYAVCVVLASEGYPGKYQTGYPIAGLQESEGTDTVVFHAGTKQEDGKTVTAGGRVLGVTAAAPTLQKAVDLAYRRAGTISWKGKFNRTDIGGKALKEQKLDAATPAVGIVMGSDSDLPVMESAAAILAEFGISYEMTVASAHRTPTRAVNWVQNAEKKGCRVIIAGAGMAAHLAGVLAAHTTLPVIGVPLDSSSLQGMDALLSTVQMPPGIPVATMGIGKAGAKNAGVLAARILATADDAIREKLAAYQNRMAEEVEEKARRVEAKVC